MAKFACLGVTIAPLPKNSPGSIVRRSLGFGCQDTGDDVFSRKKCPSLELSISPLEVNFHLYLCETESLTGVSAFDLEDVLGKFTSFRAGLFTNILRTNFFFGIVYLWDC